MALSPKDFQLIESTKTIQGYLRDAANNREFIVCRAKGTSVQFSLQVDEALQDSFRATFTDATDPAVTSRLTHMFQAQKCPAIIVLMRLQGALFFTETTVRAVENDAVTLALTPPKLYKLQRRASFRFPIRSSRHAHLVISGKKYVPHDVSAGGFSVVFKEVERLNFSNGLKLQDIQFHLSGFTETLDAAVAAQNQIQLPNGEVGWKTGFRFLNISPQLERVISQEALLFTMHYYQSAYGRR